MKEIEITFKRYLKATYSKDFDTMYTSLYEKDMQNFRDHMVEFAYKIDQFGETDDFVRRLGFKSIKEIENLSLREYMTSIFKLISREVGEKELAKIISKTKITNIKENELGWKVSYEYPIIIFGDWEMNNGEVQMTQISGEWKIYFKSGLEASFSKFQNEIDRYFDRKSKDNLNNLGFVGDLTKFSIIGYKDFSSDIIVFEPRFKDAGDFNDGLAYVQIINKYGYINSKGDIEIKPQFIDAKDFSQNMAGVKVVTDNGAFLWGFINKKGKFIIPPIYEDTRNFSDGLCAVKIDNKWGYINKKAELVIQCKFDIVDDFFAGSAYVDIINSDNEKKEFIIYKNGRIKELED